MPNFEFYNLLMDVSGAFVPAIRAQLVDQPPLPPLLQVRRGYAESPAWLLMQALEFEPEGLTVAGLRRRDSYASERIVQALLEMLASEGWLARQSDDSYHFTAMGRELIVELRTRRWQIVAHLQPLPAADLARLAQSLQQLIDASLLASEPPGTWCLAHSRRRAPAIDAAPLLQIYHFLDDFNAFRDDAHMAAWLPSGVNGATWEALAQIHAGEANTGDALFATLLHRGYARYEITAHLLDCVQRGWLVEEAGIYSVTAVGKTVQMSAEGQTDQYFYAPWQGRVEIAALQTQLLQLKEGLSSLT